jgi:hypothetical protein
MDRRTITIDPAATKLRRVGRLARRRMRIEGDALTNGTHTDGTLTVRIGGLGSPVAGVPDSFEWEADRPVALVIIRSGIDGEDVSFHVGPARFGTGRGAGLDDGTGIRYIAFCYDAAPDAVAVPALVASPSRVAPRPKPVAAPVGVARSPIPATAPGLGPTRRERRSILDLLLNGGARRSVSGSVA